MKVFLSGAESVEAFDIITAVKQKYILMSFLYLRKKKANLEQYVDKANYEVKFMIDSGAHSFLDDCVYKVLKRDFPKYKTKEDVVHAYVEEYTEWLGRNSAHIDLAVELDIGPAWWTKDELGDPLNMGLTGNVGDKLQDGWRDHFSSLQSKIGTNICFVNHGEGLEKLSGYGQYVGTSSVHTVSGSYGKVFSFAKKKGLKVHGFAVTGREIRKYPFYSVNSTSWTMGQRFGVTYYLSGGTMLSISADYKYRRKRFKGVCKDHGIDFQKFLADDSIEVAKFNCAQWKMYADYMEKRWEKKKMTSKVAEKEVENLGNLPAIIKTKEITKAEKVKSGLEIATPFALIKCDDCYIGDKCPKFLDGSKCQFGVDITINDKASVRRLLDNIVNIQYGRVLRGKMVEEADGGVPDKVLSQEIQMLVRLLREIKELGDNREEVVIKAKGKGILAKIFGE